MIVVTTSPAVVTPVVIPRHANTPMVQSATIPTKIAARIVNSHLRILSVEPVRVNATQRRRVLVIRACARLTTRLQMAINVERMGKVWPVQAESVPVGICNAEASWGQVQETIHLRATKTRVLYPANRRDSRISLVAICCRKISLTAHRVVPEGNAIV